MSRGRFPFRILLWLIAILSSNTGAAFCADDFILKAGVGTVLIHRADNLWTDGKSSIGSLADKPSGVTKLFPFPTLEAGYNDNRTNTEYYTVVSMEEPGCVTLGAERNFTKDSFLDVYGFYSLISREWKDPYVLNRESVHADEFGLKATYENVVGSGLDLSYKLTAKNIGQDASGALHPELRRNGAIHNVAVGYRIFSFLEPGVSFERGMFNGRSNSYDYRELFLRLSYRNGDFFLGAKATAGSARFDREHPVFGMTRHESRYGIDVTGSIGKPFRLPRYSVIFGSSVGRTRSNIAFFERSELLTWIGLEYSIAGSGG